ncbi:unnamed protein product [Urochloa humidicola]
MPATKKPPCTYMPISCSFKQAVFLEIMRPHPHRHASSLPGVNYFRSNLYHETPYEEAFTSWMKARPDNLKLDR